MAIRPRGPITGLILTLIAAAVGGCAAGGPAGSYFSAPVAADGATPLAPTRADQTSAGLLLRGVEADPPTTVAPLLGTNVDMAISGPFARVSVRQHFYNPNAVFVEGIYVFPLPEDAAVDHLRLQVGDRFIDGVIMDREAARQVYETAVERRRRAALLEQERPNIFASSVGNIAPCEIVRLELEYQQTLHYRDGTYAIRFPMVVGPRYVPDAGVAVVRQGPGAPAIDRTPPGTDEAGRVTPPVRDPRAGAINPLGLVATINAGGPIAELQSPYHAITTRDLGNHVVEVALADGLVPADRDFELVWRTAAGTEPDADIFSERHGGERYGVVMITPPPASHEPQVPPRDVVFVIDRSGSMEGASIRQAKTALKMALRRLRPQDRYDVVQFSHVAEALYPTMEFADRNAIDIGTRYVDRIWAEGGTEMLPALRLALSFAPDVDRLRQIVFLTDGAISNESALFDEIVANLGNGRLFTVGIGSAPNSYFMTRAATLGRGTFTRIGQTSEVRAKMLALFGKLERPVMTDITLEWSDGRRVESYPAPVPDLFQGDPIVVAARDIPDSGRLIVGGLVGGKPWRTGIDLDGQPDSPGARVIWARHKIRHLMEQIHFGQSPTSVEMAVSAVAHDHHLMSAYTSLVAVDATPIRPPDALLESMDMPTNLPHGWDFDAVFGAGAARADDTSGAVRRHRKANVEAVRPPCP